MRKLLMNYKLGDHTFKEPTINMSCMENNTNYDLSTILDNI